MSNFQQPFSAVRSAKAKTENLLYYANNALWRSLEYGKSEDIAELAKKYEMLRQKFDLLDNAIRYCQDLAPNINLLFSGKASEGLIKKYYKLAAMYKVVDSPEFTSFFRSHPPARHFTYSVEILEDCQIPIYIRKYMRENRVSPEIQEKVKAKFPQQVQEIENPYVGLI